MIVNNYESNYVPMKYPFTKWLILSIAVILITEIFRKSLPVYELIYNSLSQQFTLKQITKILDIQKKWEWVNYIFLPIILLLKTSIIASIIYIGLFFYNQDLKFNTILNFVIKAEFIFLLVPIFKILWFLFFQSNYDLNDIQNFYPLSALNITGYKNLETWLIYPFQVLNLFELFYIIYLGKQIGKATKTDIDYGLKIMSISYMPSLLLWVVTVMFFTLNYT